LSVAFNVLARTFWQMSAPFPELASLASRLSVVAMSAF